jgi:polyisoprenoid-binding protein YceI
VRRRLKWILGAVALVVVAAIGIGAYYVFGGSAPPPPKLKARAPDAAASRGGGSPVGTWTVATGPDTFVGYRMTELFAGETIHKTAVGRTPAVSGTMTLAPTAVESARVTADLSQLKSDRGPRDSYLHSHALQTDTMPNATFVLGAPTPLPSTPAPGAEIQVPVTGKLTLHGVTRDVTLTLTARWNGSSVDVVGTAPVKLSDYSIETPKTAVVTADDHGSLELQLHFVRSS